MRFDLWYNHELKDVASASCSFSDCDCMYRGFLYDVSGAIIGDLVANNSIIVEKHFPGIFGND